MTSRTVDSPSPNHVAPVNFEVWQILRHAVDGLPLNDFGRPWPYPHRLTIAGLTARYDEDHCLRAAREAREIVQSQDRAPNITALFEKKLRELAEVRSAVRGPHEDTKFVSTGEGS